MASPASSFDNRPRLVAFIATLAVLTTVQAATFAISLSASPAWAARSHWILGGSVVLYIIAVAAAAFRLIWQPILAPFPPCEPAPDAVRKRFQSFGLSIVNMGGSIHVAADADHLHLTPLLIWRMLGARPASIPWSALTPDPRNPRAARLGSSRLDGPEWCMKLIRPA